ncbi:MAG: hypothetical protein HRU41_20515 [Saprospiraceae bacterium]|nr:hypothetical protein [Saprospiraceae bacterium]
MKRHLSSLLFLFICCSTLLAQELTTQIESISEFRSSDPGETNLAIYLNYEGLNINDYTLFKVTSSSAIDNLGNRLTAIGDPDFLLPSRSHAKLEAPIREAASLQQVVMRIQCFNPSLENGAIVRIPNFYDKLGVNLLAPYSEYHDLKFVVVDSIGTRAEIAALMGKDTLPDYMGSNFKPRPDQAWFATYLLFDDPEGKIMKIDILDAEGNAVEHINWDRLSYGKIVQRRKIYFNTPIQKDWTLQLIIENKQALKEYTFEFSDLALH